MDKECRRCSRVLPSNRNEERNKLRRYPEYYAWRTSVFSRDGYRCRRCGCDKSGNLNAHHILNYNQHKNIRTHLDNGITLCVPCHREFHVKYGYQDNNKEQLNEYITKYKDALA